MIDKDKLYAAIAHGDQHHRCWLKEALDAFWADKPVPAPYGSGIPDVIVPERMERYVRRNPEDAAVD